MAGDDRAGDVDELVAVVLGVFAQHPEGLVGVDRVKGHQDPLCLLDHSSAPERSLEVVVLGEPLQRDVDRALKLLRSGVHEVSEDAAFGCLADISRVLGREQRDDGAAGFVNDFFRSARARAARREAEADERHRVVPARSPQRRPLRRPRGRSPRARACDYPGEQLEPVAARCGSRRADAESRPRPSAESLATISTRECRCRIGIESGSVSIRLEDHDEQPSAPPRITHWGDG